jgi:hypothetical protein
MGPFLGQKGLFSYGIPKKHANFIIQSCSQHISPHFLFLHRQVKFIYQLKKLTRNSEARKKKSTYDIGKIRELDPGKILKAKLTRSAFTFAVSVAVKGSLPTSWTSPRLGWSFSWTSSTPPCPTSRGTSPWSC